MTASATPRPTCGEPQRDGTPCPSVIPFKSGDQRCIAHSPFAVERKKRAEKEGGAALRRKLTKVMPPDTFPPDWSDGKSLLVWLQDRAGRVERGELDKKCLPEGLAKIAQQVHETVRLDELALELQGLKEQLRARTEGA